MVAGWFNCRRDLGGLYLVCSTTRDSFTAQELIFETLTLCVRGRVLSILLCISAWHREGANFGPHPSGLSFGGRRLELRLLQSGSAHGRFRLPLFSRETP